MSKGRSQRYTTQLMEKQLATKLNFDYSKPIEELERDIDQQISKELKELEEVRNA